MQLFNIAAKWHLNFSPAGSKEDLDHPATTTGLLQNIGAPISNGSQPPSRSHPNHFCSATKALVLLRFQRQ
jgi:hypothetical protein